LEVYLYTAYNDIDGEYPHSHSDLNANVAAGNETDNATYLSLYLRLWFCCGFKRFCFCDL